MRTIISILAGLVVILVGYLVAINWWPIARGRVVVISEPPGAQIWVDLEATNQTTNGEVTGLPAGKHSVTVKLDTLMPDPFAAVVHVRRGHTDTLRFQLRSPRGELYSEASGGQPLTDTISGNMTSTDAGIPTASDVRGQTTTEALESVFKTDAPELSEVLNEPSVSSSQNPETPAVGAIEISSSHDGAVIFINDREIAERTPASVTLPFGTYTIRVELEGYIVFPDEQSVRVSRASASQSVHFTLEMADAPEQEIVIQTTPVDGQIFVEGSLVGEGNIHVHRDYGAYQITFGEVAGWRTPPPVRVTITPSEPIQEVEARYIRLFHAYAEARDDGSVSAEGITNWNTGVIFEKGQPMPSKSLGPKISPIPNAEGVYGWELGMGDPNRNPTGGDYVEFVFTLPADVPPETPLNLRLRVPLG